jgi:hypothetical protein
MNYTYFVKQPNLKLKAWLKQLLGSLSLAFELLAPSLKNEHKVNAGSAISNGREPRSCLGRVIKFKLGSLTQ